LLKMLAAIMNRSGCCELSAASQVKCAKYQQK
jgi:hypothetical protein